MQRAYIKMLYQSKEARRLSWKDIANLAECSVDQARYWAKRHDICDGKHTGRPKTIDGTSKDAVKIETLQDPSMTLIELSKKVDISRESVRKIRKEQGFRWISYVSRVPLTEKHREGRCYFAQYIIDHPEIVPNIAFTDESMVALDFSKRKIWRIPGEILPNHFAEVDNYPIKRMVWAAIGRNYKSRLVLIDGTIDSRTYCKLLEDSGVIGDLQRFFGENLQFMQDNARAHTSAFSKDFFAKHKINLLEGWPAKSPDLNPIEHLWALLKVRMDLTKVTSLEELDQEMLRAWNTITIEEINNHVDSFPSRLVVCQEHNGNSLNGLWKEVHKHHHQN